MRIIQRYILREFLVPLGYCLTGFVAIYVLFDLFGSLSRMIDAKIGLKVAVLYFCGYLAPYFHYLVPAALMLATLYTMWMMCRHSEIVALRASGVSFLAIVRPLLGVAFVMALVVMFVNEWFMPRYAHWASQLKTLKFDQSRIVKADNIIFRNATALRTWNIDAALTDDATSLTNVRVTVDRPGSVPQKVVTAARADYLDGEWWFSGVRVQHFNDAGMEIATPTPELDRLTTLRSFCEYTETPRDFVMQNRPPKYNSVTDRIRYLKMHPELSPEARSDNIYDLWAQIVSPWACLVITLFAIPAGIASGRQSVFRGILSALGLFFSFYGVTILCMVLAKNHFVPPVIAAVFPCVVFSILGVRSFLKQR